MNKRHFTVVIGSKEHGLYVSSTPSSAAKKVVSKLCSSNKSKKVEFYLREITQGSKKKTYGPYLGEMKKLKTPIELKGRIIRYETIVHLKKNMKGGLYKCADNKKIIGELCVDDESGKYLGKLKCEIECYEEKLSLELNAWRELFAWSADNLPNNPIYCKGGSALGLEVLKTFLNKEPSKHNDYLGVNLLKHKFNDFIALNLIKDWDFTMIMSEEEKRRFIEKAEKLDIQNQGQTISILRYKKGLQIGDDYLLELSVKTEQLLSDLELPLTNLKFEVNSTNINLLFEIVVMFINDDINLHKMRENLNQLLNPIIVNGEDLVNSIENGLYVIKDSSKIETAGLSSNLLAIIDESLLSLRNNQNNQNNINPLTIKQFLITQISEPDRLFLRFFQKNLQKSKKITQFYLDNGIPLPNWLINEKVLKKILEKIYSFLDYLNLYINSKIIIPEELFNIAKDNSKKIKQIIREFIENMETLFININLTRLQNTKIDKNLIEKLIPIDTFLKLKKLSLDLRKNKENKIPEHIKKIKEEAKRKKLELGIINTEPKFDYSFYLPGGNGKYLDFLRYFLNNILENNKSINNNLRNNNSFFYYL